VEGEKRVDSICQSPYRKLAVIIGNMMVKHPPYLHPVSVSGPETKDEAGEKTAGKNH
jgi:hypothetical protein